MKFSIIALSHKRVSELHDLLNSIHNSYLSCSDFNFQVIVAINNDTPEDQEKKEGTIEYWNQKGLEVHTVFPTGNKMDTLRSSTWEICNSSKLLSEEDFYMWMDDDDVVLPELFTIIKSLIAEEPSAKYYQVGELCHYTPDQERVTVVRSGEELTANSYEDVFSMIPKFRVSLAHGEIFNVGVSNNIGMYDNPLGIHSCEDALPPLRYYAELKSKGYYSVLSHRMGIKITPSTRTYSLDEWLGAVALVSSSLGFLPKDERKREAERLIKYLVSNAYHHKKYDYQSVDWL